ncbi:MAG: hypothetical protein IPN76_34840 [Saprospiraceae bacterium]|nr:hypothetical protein [Saprospiraceae bacterium]
MPNRLHTVHWVGEVEHHMSFLVKQMRIALHRKEHEIGGRFFTLRSAEAPRCRLLNTNTKRKSGNRPARLHIRSCLTLLQGA